LGKRSGESKTSARRSNARAHDLGIRAAGRHVVLAAHHLQAYPMRAVRLRRTVATIRCNRIIVRQHETM
jgi:hypothetical protein